MKHEEKVKYATEWFMRQNPSVQAKAVKELFDHCILSEWVGVWDKDDIEELSEESGRDVSCYEAPYFRTCGEPLGS